MAYRFLVYLIFLHQVNSLSNPVLDLTASVIKKSNAEASFFFVCWNNQDKIEIQKYLQDASGVRIAFLPVCQGVVSKLDDEAFGKKIFVLDLSCESSLGILIEACQVYKLRNGYKWLVIANSSLSDASDIWSQFHQLELRLDTDVKIAVSTTDNFTYNIYEIYKLGIRADMIVRPAGNFSEENLHYFDENVSFYESRKNLHEVLLRIGSVAENVEVENPRTPVETQKLNKRESFSKLNCRLVTILREIHKFSYNSTKRSAWFGNSSAGYDGGLAKLLHERKIDISCEGGILRYFRMPYYDFWAPEYKFRTCFFFRDPGIVKPGMAVLKPFSTATWQITVAATIAMSVVIKLAYQTEYKFLRSHNCSLFTSVIITISVLSQQGSAIFPRYLGGRIVFVTILGFSILIYNYYTSSLVSSLLSSKPTVLSTIRELYESNLKAGMENQPYTTTYILQQANDIYIQQLNSNKIYENGIPNFYLPYEGIEKVKNDRFAYHTEITTAYPLIAKSFDQDSICDLAEINFVPTGVVGVMGPKYSEYTDLFTISLSKMRQSGIYKREYDTWVPKKPTCLLSSRIVSVGINQLFLVYLILIIGIFTATLILVLEMMRFKFQNN